MNLSVYLNFQGNCAEAFGFYRKVFGGDGEMTMKYSEAPANMPVDAAMKDKIMHTQINLGPGMLMGCDAPPGQSSPIGGFRVSLGIKDQAEIKRLFEALKEGGSVQMPLGSTFWSPLFGMCTDKFGVGWMLGVPSQPNS